jgi:glucuronide carrier protein
MTRPPVVTLFEKYGAGARYIGPRVADALGVTWLDQAVSSADIETESYPGADRASEAGGFLARFLGPYASGATVLDDAGIPLAQAQDAVMADENTRFVRETAEHGVVMLGRNGALILGDLSHALHVQLDAPVTVRIARAARDEGIDEVHAARRQRSEDRVRAEMAERFYHWNPMDLDRYHLVVNTGLLDLDAAVQVIVAAQRARSSRAGGASA